MAVDITELVMLRYFIDEKNKEIDVIRKERDELKEKLNRKCTHPTTKEDRVYFPGGYYDKSSVTIKHICTICDKVVESYDDPNHYGTFG